MLFLQCNIKVIYSAALAFAMKCRDVVFLLCLMCLSHTERVAMQLKWNSDTYLWLKLILSHVTESTYSVFVEQMWIIKSLCYKIRDAVLYWKWACKYFLIVFLCSLDAFSLFFFLIKWAPLILRMQKKKEKRCKQLASPPRRNTSHAKHFPSRANLQFAY